MPDIFWFRKDLRIVDNKGFAEFINKISDSSKFALIYIKNKDSFKYFGEKRISFLIECLDELKSELDLLGLTLNILEGKSSEVFEKIIREYKEVSVYCNEQVEPYCLRRDELVKKLITDSGGSFYKFTDTTIFNLGEIKNGEEKQYKVYTPFKNQCLERLTDEHYKKIRVDLNLLQKKNQIKIKAKTYDTEKNYAKLARSEFLRGGRKEALKLLKDFYEIGIVDYSKKRNFPSVRGTSLLSAHIHFGTVSIRECLRTAYVKLGKSSKGKEDIQKWMNELFWREFYYNITYHNPKIMNQSFNREYDKLKWNYDEDNFENWCKGKTGFPIVDAGMRQLNQEGWMHNRVRMITAMFLTKDLFIDWRYGEKYFADNLIDLDLSSNNGGWQWSASTGVDAQPYFRIFNPYLQSKKFDKSGAYIKKYIPELKNVPEEFIHEPHLMSGMEQKMYEVIIGKDYPQPVVEHSRAREEVIKNFKEAIGKN
ncbi:MAG: deoxyribodipyrimidine photo-lyase [bacterium]